MRDVAIAGAAQGTLLQAAAAQTLGLAAGVIAFLLAAPALPGVAAWLGVALQALVAASAARLLGMPSWWLLLHLAFGPSLLAARSLELPAAWYGSGFLALLALYGLRTLTDRVPLYLSSRRALAALSRVLPERRFSLLDLGAGTGRVLRALRRQRSDASLLGVESAPLPWLAARVSAAIDGYGMRFGDLWACDLSRHDIVYAYLSPAAMPRLWIKACAEMRAGSLLVSNAFAVPGQPPDRTLRYGRAPGEVLYLWRMR